MMENKIFEEKVYELISYMVVSARNLLDEPARYGPFRLVDAAARLISLLKEAGISSKRMEKVREDIEAGKYSAMGTEEEFEAFLESTVFCVVDGIDTDE